MELRADQLAYRCDPAALGCRVSTELPDLDAVIGQDRARGAVELGIDMARKGYHLFVMGPGAPPWDDGSINGRIARRLREYAALRRGEHRFGPKDRAPGARRSIERGR